MWNWFQTTLLELSVSIGKNWLVTTIGTATLGLLGLLYVGTVNLSTAKQLEVGNAYKSRGFAAFEAKQPKLAHVNYAQAAAIFQALAEVGNTHAQIELAKLTCLGWGVPKNQRLSEYYFREAEIDRATQKRLLGIEDFAACVPTS